MRIFLISLLLLFSELTLIRWIGTEINVFAYLQNVLLICCFMGFAIGLSVEEREKGALDFLTLLLIIVVLTAVPPLRDGLGQISVAVSALGQSFVAWNVFHGTGISWVYVPTIAMGLLLTFLIMLLVTLIFVPLGSWLGRAFAEEALPLRAYGFNLLGSLIGTWLFFLASAFTAPPYVWFLIIAALAFCWMRIEKMEIPRAVVALLLALPVVAAIPHMLERGKLLVWSPYQKLEVQDTHAPPASMEGQYVKVNNSGYQIMLDLRPESLTKRPDLYTRGWEGYTHYDLPMRFNPQAASALFLGAGSGNDTAAAVRAQIPKIVAVDIDPVIMQFGRDYHLERPYLSPSVRTEVTDARSFLASSSEKFDIISFGLLDSHTAGQMTNARLDHFVYTREALTIAASHLTERGIMTLTFEASKAHISDRIRSTLRAIFQHEPLVLRIPSTPYSFGGVMFVTGDSERIDSSLIADTKLRAMATELKYEVPQLGTAMTVDDWPYIYLEKPLIPPLFIVVAIMSVGIFLLVYRKSAGRSFDWKMHSSDIYFALLGAAFLLLEVTSISRASIVLGIAWQPSAAIITGIIVMALCSNVLVQRWAPPTPIALACVLASCIFLYFFDFASLLPLSYGVRYIVTGLIACLPMFFSGMLFSSGFVSAQDPARALAMNGLGAAVGATLQNLSLMFGLRSLLIIVAILYLFLGFCLRRDVSLGLGRTH